ncbi:hypothetical protein CRUP_007588, partial [Coryphaenoides rupestris]
MYLAMIFQLFTLHIIFYQQVTSESCTCELKNTVKTFPHDKLDTVEQAAVKCNGDLNVKKARNFDSLLLGLEKRLFQLEMDVSELEREDDGDLYGVITLQVIHNEIVEIQQLLDQLNSSHFGLQQQNSVVSEKLQDIQGEMKQLEAFDTMQGVKRELANKRLKRDLDQCKDEHSLIPTDTPQVSNHLLNVTGPRVNTAGEYPGSYKYGAWGRDPKPAVGKENWYWLVMLTSSNAYAHYVRRYSTLSSLIVGVSTPGNVQISPSNPTTNTILGPNAVLYGEALYYNCYTTAAVCRFNLTSKTVESTNLPIGTSSKGSYCHLDACYPYTDLDLATDESGVWVVYTTSQDYGNMVLSRVEDQGQQPTLGQTWRTSLYKKAASNSFVARGVLYATRYVSDKVEEIFYLLDTVTGVERFDVGIFIAKMGAHIYSLNYSPDTSMVWVTGATPSVLSEWVQ